MATGAQFYFLKYRTGARQRWFTIGQHGSRWTAATARDRAKELLGQVVDGADPAADRDHDRSNPTVEALARLAQIDAATTPRPKARSKRPGRWHRDRRWDASDQNLWHPHLFSPRKIRVGLKCLPSFAATSHVAPSASLRRLAGPSKPETVDRPPGVSGQAWGNSS
jgi:hypothetical protein